MGPAPLEVHFTDASTGSPTSWLWDFGDGSSSTARNPVHTYYGLGRYRVTLFAERAEPHSAASATGEVTVLVDEEVVADFSADPRSGDAPLSVQFTDASTGATRWSWSFGDGGTSYDRNPSHVYTVPGNYTVSLTAENDYRLDAETKVGYVSVTGPIAASFTASPHTVPVGRPVQFTDTSTGNPITFAWDFGDGATSTERNPVHTYTAPGLYDVTLTAGNGYFSHTTTALDCILVEVSPPAVVAIPGIAGPPADVDGDGLCEDLNANGRMDFADVVLFFDRMAWIAENEPVDLFDHNANGRVDFGDVVRLFDGVSSLSPTPTATPTPMTGISGHVFAVNKTGAVQGPVPGITIALVLAGGDVPAFPPEGVTTTTDANGSYAFTVPGVPATYRLVETGLDPAAWSAFNPANGTIEGVVPGGAGYDFLNRCISPDGIAIYLNRTVAPGCAGGYVVDGTTLMGDARSGDRVTLNGGRYQFQNNQQFRFTVRGDQAAGQLLVQQDELRQLTFNVEFEVRNFGTSEWMVPPGFSNRTGNRTTPVNVGVPSSISISAMNRNLLSDESTLTYRHPVCAPSETRLLLDGATRIDVPNPPGDATYLEFANLHGVRDIRYGEGRSTMWISLMPGYDYLLVQGVCVAP